VAELFASGRVIDLILLAMVLEGLALIAWSYRNGRAALCRALLPTLLAGAGLMLALRGALAGAWWGWIMLCLAASLLAHLADLRSRFASSTTEP
jgi:hypothetical protein